MAYSADYKEQAFEAWYRAGKPSYNAFVSIFRSQKGGRGPAKRTFELWADENDWKGRAAGLDSRALVVAEEQMIEERAEMLTRHRQISVLMQRKGIEFLQEHELQTEHAALRAIEGGVQMERQVRGMPQIVAAIFQMDNRMLEEFLNTAEERMAETEGEIIDVDVI